MVMEFRYSCLVETRRLLLLSGMVFGLIMFVQYIQLPYGTVLSLLLASGKSQVSSIDNSSSTDLTSRLNFTNLIGSDVESSASMVTDGKDRDKTENVKSDTSVDFSKNLNGNVNEDFDPEDDSSLTEFQQMNQTSIVTRMTNNTIVYDGDLSISNHTSESNDSESSISAKKEKLHKLEPEVLSLSGMNDMLLQSHESNQKVMPHWSSTVDHELLNVKRLIENAPIIREDPHLDVSLYQNLSAFKRSYELMEQTLKVYIYAEGERPIFHQPPLKGIYASEGWFMKLLKANKQFVTKDPKKAHLFYLPFSSRMLEVVLYQPNSHTRDNLIQPLNEYVKMISSKYHFWNRTGGSDHFLAACHDWAPYETEKIMGSCIRAMCNSDIKEGFQIGKDTSLPETLVLTPQHLLRRLGGKPPSQRKILAFFAGGMHGYVRPILLNHWENKDPDMKIFGNIGSKKKRGQMSYAMYMKSSKYCVCAKGYEVNSPRVVEAMFYECVPVIISDNFVPPFFETLNWESFAVFVLEKDIPDLKNILVSISERRYLEMHRRVKQVQQHFLWHSRPVKYDVFHMILHSIWYNRVYLS